MEWKPEAEKTVRSLFSKWAGSMPGNPFPDFADKVTFVTIVEKPSFVVQLHTLYEIRFRPMESIKPYSDATAAQAATGKAIIPDSVDIWSFESPLKNEFDPQEADVEVPDSFCAVECSICEGQATVLCIGCSGAKVVRCPECRQGKKPCEKCSGRAKTQCQLCRGKGYLPGPPKEGKPGPDVLCVNCNGSGGIPCLNCEGAGGFLCSNCKGQGSVQCIKCKGQGRQPCQSCNMTGKVVRGLVFKIQYTDTSDQSVVHDPQVAEGLLPLGFSWSKFGERIVDSQEVIVPTPDLSAHPPYLQIPVETILKKAEGGATMQAAPARIIRQSLLVERVPVFSVVYRFKEKIYDAWATVVDSKVVAKDSPFRDYAKDETMEALKLASQGKQVQAQEILSKASNLAGGSIDLEQVRRASQASSTRDFITLHQFVSVISGVAIMAYLADSSGPTHHLFWPIFCCGVSVIAVALFAGYLFAFLKSGLVTSSPTKRIAGSIGIAAVAALIGQIAYAMVQYPFRLDTREYNELLADHFRGPLQPEAMNPADVDFLKLLIHDFEPLGVDVSDAKNALDTAAKFAEDARRQAESRVNTQAVAVAKKNTKAEIIRQEIEAAKLKQIQDAAARKAKAKKKKKKRPALKPPTYTY